MTDRQIEIRRLAALPAYLSELSALTGLAVSADELLSDQETVLVRDKLKLVSKGQVIRANIPFDERTGHAFSAMIDQLYSLNSSPVVLWLPKENDCGLFAMPSVKHINFGFPFDLNPEGILVVATRDGLDRLLLDFSDEGDGNRSLEIELLGLHWSMATPPTPDS